MARQVFEKTFIDFRACWPTLLVHANKEVSWQTGTGHVVGKCANRLAEFVRIIERLGSFNPKRFKIKEQLVNFRHSAASVKSVPSSARAIHRYENLVDGLADRVAEKYTANAEWPHL